MYMWLAQALISVSWAVGSIYAFNVVNLLDHNTINVCDLVLKAALSSIAATNAI